MDVGNCCGQSRNVSNRVNARSVRSRNIVSDVPGWAWFLIALFVVLILVDSPLDRL